MSRTPTRGLFAQVETYFTDYLPKQRGASVHTVRAYRDALTLLIKFVAERLGRSVAALQLGDLDADAVMRFLDHIELERSNTAPDGHFKLPHLWPVKLPRAGRPNCELAAVLSAMREAASLRR